MNLTENELIMKIRTPFAESKDISNLKGYGIGTKPRKISIALQEEKERRRQKEAAYNYKIEQWSDSYQPYQSE